MKLAWSVTAAREMRALQRYLVERWGRTVAARYLSDVRSAARQLAVTPDRARMLRGTLWIARVRSHYLIVDVDEVSGVLTVARVLHTAADILRHLD